MSIRPTMLDGCLLSLSSLLPALFMAGKTKYLKRGMQSSQWLQRQCRTQWLPDWAGGHHSSVG